MDDGRATRRNALFPGSAWVAVALAIPIAGLIGGAVSGPVDAPAAAVVGGVLTGAGLGAAQWFAARGVFGDRWVWVATSALGYGVGLLLAAAAVGYATDIGSLAMMGALSGVVLGAAQGIALAAQGRRRFACIWAIAMPPLLATGWAATTLIGVDVDNQFTIFGALGAIVFMLLSGLILARYSPAAAEAG